MKRWFLLGVVMIVMTNSVQVPDAAPTFSASADAYVVNLSTNHLSVEANKLNRWDGNAYALAA